MRNEHKDEVPVQPVEQPILCRPYEEPDDHWLYDQGEPKRAGYRRRAGYWHKTGRVGSAQENLFEEGWDDLPLVNRLREDVRRWREAGYRGASHVTRDLLQHWWRPDLPRRLFFCQLEAAETVIYLKELRLAGRASRTGFQRFALPEEAVQRLAAGENPRFEELTQPEVYPTLVDTPEDPEARALQRMACKMATGSGKTVVMAMLIAWAFCNRGANRESRLFPSGALICCPNLTIRDRLQVLRPGHPNNYYDAFDLVPVKHREHLQAGRVVITNWHGLAPESEHKEGGESHRVVEKGPETPEAFARRVLGDLYERTPIMVLNDEGHHCWRPAPAENGAKGLSKEERQELEKEQQEATVWVAGLDRLNNATPDGPGISFCVDLSATPFYIQGSGHPEGRPFPWIVSDFGLVDAIESGIVKIPRLPVQDNTGRPEPKAFRLWEWIKNSLDPRRRLPGKDRKPDPGAVYEEAEGVLQQIAGQWKERFEYQRQATPGQEQVPPVLIVVCDDTDVAKVFYEKISGERQEEVPTEADVAEANGSGDQGRQRGRRKKQTVYGKGKVYPDYLSNTPTERRTVRIDTKLLAEAESDDPNAKKQDAAEQLRRIVSTVGKRGEPGEHVRCVVSVGMLTEGWDATNVTHILGVRAFGTQLLCEQVVGRGLRRMDYTPDPETGMLTEEYVDVYGIPFSVIPFKGRATTRAAPEDKPKNHIHAVPERSDMEIRFPVVEGYAFALRRNAVRCDVDAMEPLRLDLAREPTDTFVLPTLGYQEGHRAAASGNLRVREHNRQEYYEQTHVQAIQFEIARRVVDELLRDNGEAATEKQRELRLQSRHQLFPQVYRFVEDYVGRKVDFRGHDPRELGLEWYVNAIVERLRDAIEPNHDEGEPPLLPVLNRYKPIGTTAEVDFKTPRPCWGTRKSHLNQVVADTGTWEQSAVFRLEQAPEVAFYARNDHLGLTIPYEFREVPHSYEPDFLVRLTNGLTVLLEVKGQEDDQTAAKHQAAQRWVAAVNHWGGLGRWAFRVCRDPQTLGEQLRATHADVAPTPDGPGGPDRQAPRGEEKTSAPSE